MAELKLVTEQRPQAIDILTTWFPRIAVAVVFFFIGRAKFADQSMWARIFEQIGFGQWFRYLTGALQVGGAVMVLIPHTFAAGIVVLASTMLGAMLTWSFVLHAPGNALMPAVLFAILLAVGSQSLTKR